MWDYPRPPDVRPGGHVQVVHHGTVVADTAAALRVCETSQPPAYYLPRADVTMAVLVPSRTRTFCEWKGVATYWTLVLADGTTVPDVAWCYEHPTAGYEAIAGHLAFYAQKVDRCSVDGEVVQANDGGFYGGWITSTVVGPFKGAPGTLHW